MCQPTTAAATGFTPLDDVLGGGPRPGDLLLVGGKPGVGKTIACLQWARSMARRGATAIYLSYEHDRTPLLTRLLSCELGELAITEGRKYDRRLDELHAQLRDVAAGTLALRVALDRDELLNEAQRPLAEYGDRLIFVEASGVSTDVLALLDSITLYESGRLAVLGRVLHREEPKRRRRRRAGVLQGLPQLPLRAAGIIGGRAAVVADRRGIMSVVAVTEASSIAGLHRSRCLLVEVTFP